MTDCEVCAGVSQQALKPCVPNAVEHGQGQQPMTNIVRTTFFFFFLSVLAVPKNAFSQHVNGYCRVTSIAGVTLQVTDALEVDDAFEADDQVILIQVQANTIGNTTNSASFGNVGSIGSAGLYEVLEIESVMRTSGDLVEVTLKQAPDNVYDMSSNARVQLVTFPKLGTPDFVTHQLITCPEWDGNRGGVVAFQVAGTLELRHTIHADGKGFRGGSRSVNHGASNDCNNTFYISSSSNHGEKGEGIFRRTLNDHQYGRAHILNGGGGGSSHNGGGGGGGNFTAGGIGGAGWNGTNGGCSPSTSGIGGLGLSDYIDPNRVFFGGGGGGGQQNNTASTDGMPGGGIVFIKATQLVTPDEVCSLRISADGGSASTAGNDGAGGGGAGGSIVFQVDAFEVEDDCPLTIRANGGNGGNVNSSTHAGGGGGGQGTVVFPDSQPMENISTTTLNGTGGCDNSSCSQRAASGQGIDNIGILTGMPSLLNALGIDLNADSQAKKVNLEWFITEATEAKPYATRVERSRDLNSWLPVAWDVLFPDDVANATDHPGEGVWYYRAAVEGAAVYSNVRPIEIAYDGPLIRSYFPNPAGEVANLRLNGTHSGICRVIAPDGRTVKQVDFRAAHNLVLALSDVAPGVYIIELQVDERRELVRLKVR